MTHDPALCVDLDGTLLATDLLQESFLAAFRRRPWIALQCVGWLLQGRARLKEELARRSSIDVAALPYREPVLAFLREERLRGRRIVLATAAWSSLAEAVARHVGVFDAVVATTAGHNLKGEAKARALAESCGPSGFDYLGDSHADFAVWRQSRRAYVVDTRGVVAKSMPKEVRVARVFGPEVARGSRIGGLASSLRPHQWAKNLLLFAPLAAAHRLDEPALVAAAITAFVAFCLVASSTYVVNDLLDLAADRAHAVKRARPLASGAITIGEALALAAVALAAGVALALALPPAFLAGLAAYVALTLLYSFALKKVTVLDVIALASLYTLRIIAGSLAVGVPLSFWLLAFSLFFFFSLALVKRYAELIALEARDAASVPGRGYAGHDAEMVMALGTSSALVSALVLALYINGDTVRALYSSPAVLWLLCPLLLYWIARVWVLAARGAMNEDPVLFAMRDPPSYAVAAAGAAVVWLAT